MGCFFILHLAGIFARMKNKRILKILSTKLIMNKFDTKYPFGKYKIVPRYREGIGKIYARYMQGIC